MTKVTRTGSRGTSSREVDSDEKSNWAGDEFKEYQKKKAEEHPDESVTTHRGTGSTDVGDIPETETAWIYGAVCYCGDGCSAIKQTICSGE